MGVISIDNGVSGSIAYLSRAGNVCRFVKVPARKEQNYTKAKSTIQRIDHAALDSLIKSFILLNKECKEEKFMRVVIERPFVNPKGFKATVSAVRALEAVLVVVEQLKLPVEYVDSKQWQKEMLPKGCAGTPELKFASCSIGCRLFPSVSKEITKHGDADSLLMAEWARRER